MSERLNANPENISNQNNTNTGWESLSEVPFAGDKQVAANANPNESKIANTADNHNRIRRLSNTELIELTAEWNNVKINQPALQQATQKNGNPNVHGKGLFFKSGNLPMSDDSVYRHVGTAAITDLMAMGFVRNAREAAGALDKPGKNGFGTVDASVYWYNGNSRVHEKADLVIEANKSAAESGYVTKDNVRGIWVTDKDTGQPVNLIDGQDHTGLEIADHKL
ncbi:hypothetical protein IJG78_03000 [Candidatus Saccharibacteria bacterium]|nr:hypothetical protein [Candidatus Saccharibacteria bacterium]